MGRDLKFRAWDKNTSEWVYAELDTSRALSTVRLVNSSEWLQYTGLKDKNGVEIYEGDIVRMHYFSIDTGISGGAVECDNEVVGTIAYRPDFATWVVDREMDYVIERYCQEPSEELEVIGNIYENPDLINNELIKGESE